MSEQGAAKVEYIALIVLVALIAHPAVLTFGSHTRDHLCDSIAIGPDVNSDSLISPTDILSITNSTIELQL